MSLKNLILSGVIVISAVPVFAQESSLRAGQSAVVCENSYSGIEAASAQLNRKLDAETLEFTGLVASYRTSHVRRPYKVSAPAIHVASGYTHVCVTVTKE